MPCRKHYNHATEIFICICLQYPERLPTHGYCILLALVWPNSSPSEVNSGLGWSMSKKLPSIARNIWSMSTLIASVSFYQIKTTLINVHDPTAQLWTCAVSKNLFVKTWTFRIHIKITWIFWTYDWRIGCIRSTNPRPLHAVFRSFMIDLFPSVSFMSIWGRDCPSFCRISFSLRVSPNPFFSLSAALWCQVVKAQVGRDRCHPFSSAWESQQVSSAGESVGQVGLWVCVLFNMSTTTWPGSGGGAEEGPTDLAGVATVRRSSCGSCFTGTWHWPEGAGCWTSCGAGTWATWAGVGTCADGAGGAATWATSTDGAGTWAGGAGGVATWATSTGGAGTWAGGAGGAGTCFWIFAGFPLSCAFFTAFVFFEAFFPLVIHLPLPRPFFLLPLLVWCFAGFASFLALVDPVCWALPVVRAKIGVSPTLRSKACWSSVSGALRFFWYCCCACWDSESLISFAFFTAVICFASSSSVGGMVASEFSESDRWTSPPAASFRCSFWPPSAGFFCHVLASTCNVLHTRHDIIILLKRVVHWKFTFEPLAVMNEPNKKHTTCHIYDLCCTLVFHYHGCDHELSLDGTGCYVQNAKHTSIGFWWSKTVNK